MLRHDVQPRSPFVCVAPRPGRREGPVRRSAAPAARLARVMLAPLAAIAAAVAGILFVVLLPICGIASIAEAAAKASWGFARDAVAGARGRSGESG